MDQVGSNSIQMRVFLFSNILLAGGLLIGVFIAGFAIGKNQNPPTIKMTFPKNVSLSLPEGVQITGIPDEQVNCLRWTSGHFKDPTVGLLSLVCNGK